MASWLTGTLLDAARMLGIHRRLPLLSWRDLIEWFAEFKELKIASPDNIAFSLLRRVDGSKIDSLSGPFSFVQGIYNKTSQQFIESRVVEALEIDDELRSAHADSELVFYE